MKNQGSFELMFQILNGLPDDISGSSAENEKHWENEEQNAVKIIYKILADVFRADTDMNIRQFAMDNQFIDRILDRIAIISRESKRKYYSDQEIEEQN